MVITLLYHCVLHGYYFVAGNRKASGPGFDSRQQPRFFTFSFAFFQKVRKFQSSLYEGSELDNTVVLCNITRQVYSTFCAQSHG